MTHLQDLVVGKLAAKSVICFLNTTAQSQSLQSNEGTAWQDDSSNTQRHL